MINFVSCFTLGKAHGWGTFLKRGAELAYHLVLGLLFWKCFHSRALSYTYSLVLYCFTSLTSSLNQFTSCQSCLCIINLCFVLKSIGPTLFMQLWDSKLHFKTNCDLLFLCNFVIWYSFLLLWFWSFLVLGFGFCVGLGIICNLALELCFVKFCKTFMFLICLLCASFFCLHCAPWLTRKAWRQVLFGKLIVEIGW
jgi:hypothetical protein